MRWSWKNERNEQDPGASVRSPETKSEGPREEATVAAAQPIRVPAAVKIGCVLVILLALGGFATQLMKYNEIRSQTERIREEISAYELKIARMQYLVGAPLDPTYIQETAREKLGLHYPDETLYYNDLNDPEQE